MMRKIVFGFMFVVALFSTNLFAGLKDDFVQIFRDVAEKVASESNDTEITAESILKEIFKDKYLNYDFTEIYELFKNKNKEQGLKRLEKFIFNLLDHMHKYYKQQSSDGVCNKYECFIVKVTSDLRMLLENSHGKALKILFSRKDNKRKRDN